MSHHRAVVTAGASVWPSGCRARAPVGHLCRASRLGTEAWVVPIAVSLQESVDAYCVGESCHDDATIDNHGRRELGKIAESVAGHVLLAAPQQLRDIGSIERVERARRGCVPRVRLGSVCPEDPPLPAVPFEDTVRMPPGWAGEAERDE